MLTTIDGNGAGAHGHDAGGWDMKAFVKASRASQGLPAVVQDAVVLERVAAVFQAVECAPNRSARADAEAAGASCTVA
jgi:hypothetical protein